MSNNALERRINAAPAVPSLAGIDPANLAQLATGIAHSDLVPRALRGKPADIYIVLQTGRELGLGPMQAMRGVNVIDGKATLAADMMGALAMASPVCEYLTLVESTAEKCTYEAKRRGSPRPTRMEFTRADAERAGLWGRGGWSKYPAAMLRARCLSAVVRAVFPDLMMGVYDPDELAAPIDAGPARVYEVEPVEPAKPEPAPPKRTAADALEDVLALAGDDAQDLDAFLAETQPGLPHLADMRVEQLDAVAAKLRNGWGPRLAEWSRRHDREDASPEDGGFAEEEVPE